MPDSKYSSFSKKKHSRNSRHSSTYSRLIFYEKLGTRNITEPGPIQEIRPNDSVQFEIDQDNIRVIRGIRDLKLSFWRANKWATWTKFIDPAGAIFILRIAVEIECGLISITPWICLKRGYAVLIFTAKIQLILFRKQIK